MDSTARRIVQMQDWAPAQEAMFADATEPGAAQPLRLRSMSVSLPWRPRPKSALLDPANLDAQYYNLSLKKSKSHGFDEGEGNSHLAPPSSKPQHGGNFKRMLRRASVSLKEGVKGFVHRRTSVPAIFDSDGQHSRALFAGPSHGAPRPTTSHSTWHRLRQATSFHRHSRTLHTGYGERMFDQELFPIESPTLPVPGSGEQPPIIPRKTGAAARHAAAIACNGLHGYDLMAMPMPRPGWLAEDALDDRESGIGIALTSSEMEAYVPGEDLDSDVDVGSGVTPDETPIIKVDFISQLPFELAIQVLSLLDAATLNTASRVCSSWYKVITNQHIWRESFLREKTTTFATSGPVKPGTGLGIPPVHPANDWKEIYRVKTELDRRWKEGKARPVYLNGHTDSIYCLQFDESKIITGSRDRTIRVWDMHTFACKLIIGPPEIVHEGSFSLLYDEHHNPIHYATIPDIDPSPTADGLPRAPVRAYHSVPALYAPPVHHKASILCLQYDDEILVTGSSDATCIVYTLAAGYRPVRRLRHHSAAVLDLVFDEKHIVTCSKDVSICVWDRATGALLRQLRGHAGPVNAVQMRGNTIVSCSGDFRVKLWNIDTGKNIREFLGHKKGLACSQFSEDGRYIASAGNDKVIRIWDANTGECVREMEAHGDLVRSLHVDSVSGRLVSGSYDSDIKVWDMETGQPLLDFPKWHSSWVLSAKSDYRRIVSSGQDPKILILDFGAGVKGIEMLESCGRGAAGSEEVGYI
ncbi:WD40-repeat-containing domain protein [Chaetomium strumarium]|uniref:WD40-repeat-containing domain protein n=1 Tax=Chaetomium strumarium TaxID=1170767 RepID=A0AAJ0GMF5_9PEZI|nr:WD40-repeat-containing domain protein [Chaetomium strumarium]